MDYYLSCLFWDEWLNKKGYDSFESVLNNGMPAKVTDLKKCRRNRALILDTKKWCFTAGFIPQSINIGIDGDFAHGLVPID
jgi:hypothetical protein